MGELWRGCARPLIRRCLLYVHIERSDGSNYSELNNVVLYGVVNRCVPVSACSGWRTMSHVMRDNACLC